MTVNATDKSTAGANVIELSNVVKTFGSFTAVHNANIDIANGEFFSLLGPSGCGKTTTLRMIAGFELPTSGEIRLNGTDVSRTPAHKRNINTVFQHYALFPHLSVAKNVAYGPKSRGVAKAEIAAQVTEMLDVVRLSDLANRKPSQLSGGQQQRVALARALVNTPEALLLDEPLGALDLKLRQTMQFELKRIQREVGLAFVYVTHDQEEALTMSDRIAVMNNGYVEQIGTPEEIYNAPASVFVAGFIGEANLWAATPTDTAGVLDALGQRLPASSDTELSGDCTVMVRPERIEVTMNETTDGRTCVRVTIAELTFQGPVIRLDAVAADQASVVAHVRADAGLPQLNAGDEVFCSWPADAARAMQGRPAIVAGEGV